ncbi:MAG: hypothetical protein ICCCNLDF_03219 [Planctomycetes bacterium]|nr:hypothetical protein [Planctomycetota bacterium]
MRDWWEFTLTVRPWIARGRGRKTRPKRLSKVTIIARSGFDAIYAYKAKNPRMLVVSCKKGKRAKPPEQAGS